MSLTADQRETIYLRDRTTLTPAQARRVRKHQHRETAAITPQLRRQARRDVLRTDRGRRLGFRLLFAHARRSR